MQSGTAKLGNDSVPFITGSVNIGERTYSNFDYAISKYENNQIFIYFVVTSEKKITIRFQSIDIYGRPIDVTSQQLVEIDSQTKNEHIPYGVYGTTSLENVIPYFDNSIDDPFTILLEGEKEYTSHIVPVQWMRSDGEILEDTFTITIGEEGDDDPPQPDPFVGYADVSYNGHFYNINRKKVPAIHYANGVVWQEGNPTEYNVEQAASIGMLILLR